MIARDLLYTNPRIEPHLFRWRTEAYLQSADVQKMPFESFFNRIFANTSLNNYPTLSQVTSN